MNTIIGYKGISLGEMSRIINGYVENYRCALNFEYSYSQSYNDLMGNIADKVMEWHRNTILKDADQTDVHKLRMKVGIGDEGIIQIPYGETAYDEFDNVFVIAIVYDGSYDLNEYVMDVFHVNMEVIG